jgi:hypothetical protein
MSTKKTGTFEKVTQSVKKAAKAVAATADEYVVEPVGKALGLKKPRKRSGHAKSRKTGIAAAKKRKPARARTTSAK